MGNKNKPEPVPHNNVYETIEGHLVNTDGHSKEFMNEISRKISNWIGGEGRSPDAYMGVEEIGYILNNMVDSENNPDIPSGYLTRVESAYHFDEMIENGLKAGDTIPSESNFRSYSRTQMGSWEYMHMKSGHKVIYRTHGNVPSFKASDFNEDYGFEQESWVQQGKMIYMGNHTISPQNYNSKEEYVKDVCKELDLDFDEVYSGYFAPDSVTVVDVYYKN